jgi:hypothetical protein
MDTADAEFTHFAQAGQVMSDAAPRRVVILGGGFAVLPSRPPGTAVLHNPTPMDRALEAV